MNNTKHRSPFAIAARLIVLVRPMLPIMLAAIVMGVIGHFCATFITPCCAASCAMQSRLPTTLSLSSCWPSSGIRCSARSAA